jgi:hypothetical protein
MPDSAKRLGSQGSREHPSSIPLLSAPLTTPGPNVCFAPLFAGGKNLKQIQTWPGALRTGLQPRTYIHLLDDGIGSADFLNNLSR